MSLILEALKKSETRRRLGEAPDIGTPFTVRERRRNPWPLVVLLLAAAAGAGWWYLHTRPQPTPANTVVSLPSPPAAPPAAKNPANTPPSGALAKTGASPAQRESAPGQPKPAAPAGAGLAARFPPRTDGGVAGETAPGSVDLKTIRPINGQLVPPAPEPAPTAPANPPTVPANTAHASIDRPTPLPATAAASAKPASVPAAATPAPPAGVAKAEPDPAAAGPTVAPPPASAPLAVPQYYELAYAVRKDIPQFNLSMHVFAADAAARFIVVDGERKAEGDTVKDGLILREVRTDGVILEFRGQRFFYPRPGH